MTFDELYNESLTRLDAYIATQKTQDQILDAKHVKRHVEINKRFYEHRHAKGELLYICSSCGQLEAATYTEPTRTQMLDRNVCFHCNYWAEIVTEHPVNRVIVDGKVYSDAGNDDGHSISRFRGHGGHVWHIQDGNGHRWETNNLWFNGVVPEEYRVKLPDNAKFLYPNK